MTTNQEIAKTILAQLGGNRFRVMTGAKDFVAVDKGLGFSLPKYPGVKVNRVTVVLKADDTYTVIFSRWYNMTMTPLDKAEGVYCEDLERVFTDRTGLLTRMN
jgi:hypothetical protein